MFTNPALPLSDLTPVPEGPASAGALSAGARGDHKHPRLSSATTHTLNASGEATIVFTRSFPIPPCMDFTYIELADNPPVTFKVKSWTQDGGGNYTGCIAKGYRGQALPSSILTLVALVSYNVFGGSASGVSFTALAIAQSP